MSVLKAYFDSSINQCSRVIDDFQRIVDIDDSGSELVRYEKFDYPKFQSSLGTVDMWSLDALVKAGIDPSFSIHTGLSTRLEGIDTVNDAAAAFDKVFEEEKTKNEN